MKKLAKKGESGSALIIVILFMVLVVGLAVLILVKSVTSLQVSSNSVSTVKASDLALSGTDIILGDLKQEIIAGSTATTYGTAPNTYNVYTPKPTATGALSTAVPAITGFTPVLANGIETDGLANLVKISQYNTPFYSSTLNTNYSNTGAARASQVNSNLAALSGRVITPARWNSHFLLGRPTTSQGTGLNSAPMATFPSPDWIIVTRKGASTPFAVADLPNLKNSANADYAVGRFAYAVYDEGGTLDMNVAGYPSTLTAQQNSQKSSLAFADLTQLGLTQSQVDQIVGWRNPATAQLGTAGALFGSVSFNAASSSNWLNNFVNYNYCQTNPTSAKFGVKNGFLTVNSTITPPPGGPNCDQMLVNRQQLISLVESLGISPDVLQYMGTFTRSLEQPSFAPNPNRPQIISPTIPPPQAANGTNITPNELSYMGNNDAAGGDKLINPPFMTIRVLNSFTRLNGQAAKVGEPLVISRFSLNNLAMVAYNATNSALPTGFSVSGSDPDPIYDHFGLKRSATSAPWVYNHGQNSIMTLEQVAAANREPDFAELLKASITVGALAKGAPTLHPSQSNYQYTIDTTTDYQILQIMANIIDQQDADSYPTSIQIASGPTGITTIEGVEDLPYFYQFHPMAVVDQLPSPLLTHANLLTIPATGTETVAPLNQWTFPVGNETACSASYTVKAGYAVDHCALTSTVGALNSPGEVTYLLIPDVWNPHDTSTALNSNTSLRPKQYRIFAQTASPLGTLGWQAYFNSSPGSGYYPQNVLPLNDGANPPVNCYCPTSPPTTLSVANTELDFSDVNGTLFREPTMLWRTGFPIGASVLPRGTNAPVTDANTGNTYVGLVVGKAPISTQFSLTSSPANASVDGTYICQMSTIALQSYIPLKTGGQAQYSFVMQYLDANGNWITYDAQYSDYHSLVNPTLVANVAEFPFNSYWNPFGGSGCGQLPDLAPVNGGDPRTARWGVGNSAQTGQYSPGQNESNQGESYLLEPTGNLYATNGNTAPRLALGQSNFTIWETQRPGGDKGNHINYSNPGMSSDPGYNLQYRLFSGIGYSASNGQGAAPLEFDGLMSQNNPMETFLARDNSTQAEYYFEDADGIARRAMGAYVDSTVLGTPNAMTDASSSALVQPITSSPTRIGLPMATANSFVGNNGVPSPTQQLQSRPIILNRPFKSVSELSYAFTGTPWKNIDFFTPESGYSVLLDTFCVGQTPATTQLVAGKVDLNTRQQPVLKALISGATRDEYYNTSVTPTYALPPVTSTEAGLAGQRLVAFTSDTKDVWRGPIGNVSELVGRFVPNMTPSPTPITAGALPDWFTYVPPTNASGGSNEVTTATYAGFTSLLDSTVYTNTTNSTQLVAPIIQRFREAALRPLADCGQTRVWNLLIDVIAQTGKYPPSASGLDQFAVDGEKRLWVHVAIDRFTGQVLDEQIENVAQ